MAKAHLYSVWCLPNEDLKKGYTAAFHVAKYNRSTLIEEKESYTVKLYSRNNWYRCDCPGFVNHGHCRHQAIVQIFVKADKVGEGSLFDFDSNRWSNQFVEVPEESK